MTESRAGRALLVALALALLLVLVARGPHLPEPHKSWQNAGHAVRPDPSWTFRPDPSWTFRADPSWQHAQHSLGPDPSWGRPHPRD
jgi:hypothetical protein